MIRSQPLFKFAPTFSNLWQLFLEFRGHICGAVLSKHNTKKNRSAGYGVASGRIIACVSGKGKLVFALSEKITQTASNLLAVCEGITLHAYEFFYERQNTTFTTNARTKEPLAFVN